MSVKLRPYPEYKESGVAWLGNIPSHWGTKPLKHLVGNVVVTTDEKLEDDAYVALENVEGWTGVVRPRMGTVEFDSQVKRFLSGDILFGKLRPYLAKVARPTCNGVCVGEFLVLRAKGGAVDAQLLEMQLRSPGFIGLVSSSAYGAKMPRAEWQFIGNIPMPCPPHDSREREAVVGYLTSVDRAIRSAIRAKRRQIELLNEQKQVFINRLVTRGLEPTVRLKPSGIGWLGEIPEHWNIVRIRSLAKLVTSGSRGWAQYYSDNGPIFLRIGNLSTDDIDLNLQRVQRVQVLQGREGIRTRVQSDDILMSITALMGAVGIVPSDLGEAYVNQHIALVRLDNARCVPRWISYVLTSSIGKSQCSVLTNGGTKDGLGLDDVKGIRVLLPPRLEQERLVETLDAELARLNRSAGRVHRQIGLLLEYRTRLIADVVTGKLDVRGVELPDLEGIAVADDFGDSDFDSDADQDDLPDAQEVEADGED